MLRDKDYIRTAEDLLFNVTGYEHPADAVYASLKYVRGEKWTAGYGAACEFLKQELPKFVDGYLRVPRDAVKQVYDPRQRWSELLAERSAGEVVSTLHVEALDLAEQLSEILQIPLAEFGITDSLLWGDGHPGSDIDLIVMGLNHSQRILDRGAMIYESHDFERPDPERMTAPYGLEVADWPQLLSRKLHMGCFRGRLFSLRVVLEDEELPRERVETIDTVGESAEIEFVVADATRSLLFPAIYRNAAGDELVDYSVVYEGVFRAGDGVTCRATQEVMQAGEKKWTRWTMSGVG